MDVITKLTNAVWLSSRSLDSAAGQAAGSGSGSTAQTGNEVAYFRCAFALDRPATLLLSVSAHSRYRLWVNGEAVASGPCKGDRWRHYYETLDLSAYLHEGDNVIAAKVVAYSPYETQAPGAGGPYSVTSNAAGPCFIASGACLDEHGGVLVDVSTLRQNSLWRVCLDEAVAWEPYRPTHFMGPMERVDGGRIPLNWNGIGAVKGDWRIPVARWKADGRPYGIIPPFPLQERPIPLLYEKRREFVSRVSSGGLTGGRGIGSVGAPAAAAETVPPRSKRVIVWDAGEVTTGYVKLTVRGGGGSEIRLLYAESYSKKRDRSFPLKGKRDDAVNFDLIGQQDVYRPSGSASGETYEPFWFRTFRFVQIEVETAEEEVVVCPPSYLETGYPLDAGSTVASEADWIRPLWDVSVRTLQRCMHETYEDCPYYEQLQYTMDTRLQILYTYAVSGDARMAKRAIEDYHASLLPEGVLQARFPCTESQVIPAFSLHWIFMVDDYYGQTGDASVAKRYRATIDAVLDWYDRKLGSVGLVEKLGYWEFIDWVPEWNELHGSPSATIHGPSTIHNLVYASALRSAAGLSRLAGRMETAGEYNERANRVIEAVNTQCWSERVGLYREGPDFEQYSQHAQVWAVLAGAVQGEAARTLMKRMLEKDNLLQCSYAMSYYLFRALEQVDMYEETEALWKPWKELLALNLTTWPEDPFMQRSDCHGWGALPLYEFVRCLLGIAPAEPGWASIRIEPKCLSLPDMKGEAITPQGIVSVEWRREGERCILSGESPAGTPTELRLPDGSRYELPNGGAFMVETGGESR